MSSIIARRRHPAAGYAAVAGGLVLAGVLYSTLSGGGASAAAPAQTSTQIEQGRSLFLQSCSSCHGLEAQGTAQAPSLIGAGAAAVYFQMSTGRMPAKEVGAENERKPSEFTPQEIYDIAAYVASLGGGPANPWHWAQFVLYSSEPSAVFAPTVDTSAPVGMAGPPPSDAT